jgi:hypothetical protein
MRCPKESKMGATPYTVKGTVTNHFKHGPLLEVRTNFRQNAMNIPCSLLYEVRWKNTSAPQTVFWRCRLFFTLTGFGGESGFAWSELFSAEPRRRYRLIHIHGSTSLFKSWRPPRHNSRARKREYGNMGNWLPPNPTAEQGASSVALTVPQMSAALG